MRYFRFIHGILEVIYELDVDQHRERCLHNSVHGKANDGNWAESKYDWDGWEEITHKQAFIYLI